MFEITGDNPKIISAVCISNPEQRPNEINTPVNLFLEILWEITKSMSGPGINVSVIEEIRNNNISVFMFYFIIYICSKLLIYG